MKVIEDIVTKSVNKALSNRRPAGGYFGTRKYKDFPPSFVDLITESEGLVDITAGTGQFPYALA